MFAEHRAINGNKIDTKLYTYLYRPGAQQRCPLLADTLERAVIFYDLGLSGFPGPLFPARWLPRYLEWSVALAATISRELDA